MSVSFEPGFLIGAVGAAGVLIAGGQWHTARTKLAFDLFERRLAVANELFEIIGSVLVTGEATTEDILKFGGLESRASYLFGTEVTDYLASNYVWS